MNIIEGFQQAKKVLSRSAVTGLAEVSPALRERLEEMWGTDDVEAIVNRMVTAVRSRGDGALREYTFKIDGVNLESFTVSAEEINNARNKVPAEILAALEIATARIKAFHQLQRDAIWGGVSRMNGQQMIRPLERVGVYAPGGTAAYPSTVLMTAIPAKVAGVKDLILATPAGKNGKIPSLVLAAAGIAGVDKVYALGGALAIAAMAYGTGSVPKVDKICGPGNIFVMLAKKLVYGVVDIDGLQGPSEVLIVADENANPVYCAADLLAQAEHDPLASAIMITTSSEMTGKVNRELERQLAELPRSEIARRALEQRGKMVLVANLDEAIELANLYAPEHLCLMVQDAAKYVEKITNAGCIFAGEGSAEVLGDYVAGPSHALPTGGTARFGSPLNVNDFTKLIDVVAIEQPQGVDLWQAAAVIARAEGLEAHARAADFRIKNIQDNSKR